MRTVLLTDIYTTNSIISKVKLCEVPGCRVNDYIIVRKHISIHDCPVLLKEVIFVKWYLLSKENT